MTTTPEEQALIEAAVKWADAPMFSGGNKLVEAVAAYRATLTPKECRPPSDAKDGSLWWLAHGNIWIVAQLHPQERWLIIYPSMTALATFAEAARDGWTVHSPCTFPGEHEAIVEQLCDIAEKCVCGDNASRMSCAHFRFKSPKLRSPSDAEIERLASRCDLPPTWRNNILAFARAVERPIKGEEV